MNKSKLIVGCWQLDNRSWKDVPQNKVQRAIEKYLDLGVNQFDTADIYGRSEAMLGEILKGVDCRIFTKAVFFGEPPSKGDLMQKVEQSLKNLNRSSLDCLQIHMHDAKWSLEEIFTCMAKLKRNGIVKKIGVTNFNSDMLSSALEFSDIDYHQLQYSLIDRRVELGMQQLCLDNNIGMLPYGALAGGYLSEAFIAQNSYSEEQGHARSGYYKRMIENHGGWSKVASLRDALQKVSQKNKLKISQVAMQWVLKQDAVEAVICGLTIDEEKITQNVHGLENMISDDDVAYLSKVSSESFAQNGDIYSYERSK